MFVEKDFDLTTYIEQKKLLNQARESIAAAKLLAREHFYAFAVSRAYYSLFYTAQAFLLGKGLAFSKHKGVISAFGEYFAKTGEVPIRFHKWLSQSQEARNKADYDDIQLSTKADADLHIQWATDFLEFSQDYLKV